MQPNPKQEQETESQLITIDLRSVVASKLGRKSALVPGWLVGRLEKVICQDRLNEMLRVAYPRRGADFCEAVIRHLDVRVDIRHAERLPDSADRNVIFVSNHPLGGLDGMILIHLLTRHYGVEPRFVVNDLLMAVEPLSDVFLPVNKHGSQSRNSTRAIDEAMADPDRPVVVFPAGLCSRLRDGSVADLEWHKMFVQKARQFGRDIIPLHFDGCNSRKFYRTARLRERLGIKFNIEMVLLPSEVFKAQGKTFAITVGEKIPADTLDRDARAETRRIRAIVDNLSLT
ncbi:MAG: 1-acyl-sn-glycerol-3-phosphate acyltransferase [Muribaculaceae bacterium]|nr:1-acyl-sn-glycerol-3-phosphate acyltransferase [Muribaculaceae bacterium]